MRRTPSFKSVSSICLCVAVTSTILLTTGYAQRRNRNPGTTTPTRTPTAIRTPELKKIDVKAKTVENEFVREAFGLATEYEKAGDLERAIEYLEAMLKINPELDGAKQKIDDLKDEILSANDFDIDLQASPAWGSPVAYVRSGKPFRVRSAGTYKFTLSESVGPEGFPVGDLQKHMIADVAAGKLVGVVINPNSKDKKPGEPFAVGEEREVNPEESGYLFLKVNLPTEARCSGTLQVRLSGYVLSPDGRNVGK
jgi:hypothetical protein